MMQYEAPLYLPLDGQLLCPEVRGAKHGADVATCQ